LHYSKNAAFDKWGCLANLTMIQYYLNRYDINGAYWSLVIELLFYANILLIYLLKKLDKIEIIGYTGLAYVLINCLIIRYYFPSLSKTIENAFPLVNYIPLFFAGIFFYKLKFEEKSFRHYLGIGACYILHCFYKYDGSGIVYKIDFYTYAGMLGIYFLLFILYVNNKLLFIVSKFTLFFGAISYALYLISAAFGNKLFIPSLIESFGFSFIPAALIAFAFSVGLSALVTFYFERPLIQYFKKRI